MRDQGRGTPGFWWCGRYGMHRWSMPIKPLEADPAAYDRVTICAPIWVFGMAAPVRRFCEEQAGRIKEADYILCHHTPGEYRGVAREMDNLLGLTASPLRSVQCRVGRMKLCTQERISE